MRIEARIGSQALIDKLAAMAEFVESPRDALSEAADVFLVRERTYLDTAQWKPLKAATARRKARKGKSTRPLMGGALEKSLTHKGARFSVRRLNKQSIVVGTKDPVANIHQSGSRGGRIPRRPLVRVSQADAAVYAEVFRRHLNEVRLTRYRRGR